MGFSLGAILSNRNNRNLQRKSRFGEDGLIGKGFSGQKAPIDEVNMENIARRFLWTEIVFYGVVIGLALVGVYFWLG